VESSAGEHTFVFADLAGFTALTEAMGDDEAADLAGEFCDSVRDLAPQFAAEAVKTIGDALMLRGDDAGQAIRLGLHVVNEIGGQHYWPTVRVGMHTGPAAERGGDWFGSTVNVAARVSGLAGGGEVLLTEATREAAFNVDAVEIREHGRHPLKNVSEPMLLYVAHRAGERSAAGFPIDPVCRMAVDPERAAGTLRHEDTEYTFCSLDCARRFAEAPERHVRG
jgi:adenylate cyclase